MLFKGEVLFLQHSYSFGPSNQELWNLFGALVHQVLENDFAKFKANLSQLFLKLLPPIIVFLNLAISENLLPLVKVTDLSVPRGVEEGNHYRVTSTIGH